MARKKTAREREDARNLLAERLKMVRVELFGEHGGPELARRLGIPGRTWYNYEVGVTVPAEVVLRFIDLTAVEPKWLLAGQGDKYRIPPHGAVGNHVAGEGVRLADLFSQVSERLREGHLVIDVSWKKST
jgi:hypothetical protein